MVVVIIALIYCLIVNVFGDIGCSSIINNNTCLINRTSSWQPWVGNIVCNDSLPICIVLCQTVLSCSDNINGDRISIICPNNAAQCIVNCTASRSCRNSKIFAINSNFTEINIKHNNAGRGIDIYQSGQLYVNVIGSNADFYESTIYSLINSTNIYINCDDGEICTKNTIYARNTTQSISISCNGNTDCSHSNIWCPMHSTLSSSICNINCSMCQNINVYTKNGISDINWQCDNHKASCMHSKLFCGVNQDNFISNLLWNSTHSQWRFDPNICTSNLMETVTSNLMETVTSNPSIDPTADPTIDPTNSPSIDPFDSTLLPAYSPSIYSIDTINNDKPESTIIVIIDNVDEEETVIPITETAKFYIIMILASIVCICCIVLFFGRYYLYKYRRGAHKKHKREFEINQLIDKQSDADQLKIGEIGNDISESVEICSSKDTDSDKGIDVDNKNNKFIA